MIALLRALFDPRLASHVAAVLIGDPDLGSVLERICERESGCQAIGQHRIDARWSSWAWRTAVRSGRLDASCQPLHSGWSTRGAWGAMAAFTVVHIGVPCLPAWVIDVPLLGAYSAAKRAIHPDCRRYAACRRWRGW